MKEYIFLISGSIILIIIIYDFFYTTLSGSGAAFMSRTFLNLAHKFLLGLSKLFGSTMFNLSGMVVNIILLLMWMSLVWLGLFLIFSFDPEGLINSSERAATGIERLYYTGYVLSTLGIGNFFPNTPFLEIMTSIFSFFGFIFFTTSMAYILSISSAILHKRVIAISIRSLGENPMQIVDTLIKLEEPIRKQKIIYLQQMLDKHFINHTAYPVLHYYVTANESNSFGINITNLDEAISILISSRSFESNYQDVLQLRESISHLFHHLKEEYGLASDINLDIQWKNLDFPSKLYGSGFEDIESLTTRRRVLAGLLKVESLNWKYIYQADKKEEEYS